MTKTTHPARGLGWPLTIAVIVASLVMGAPMIHHATAKDLFVDNRAGDDQRDGTSAVSRGKVGGPLRTIACALELAEKGDRIIVANTGEPYHESVTLQAGRHSGLPRQPFTIIGNGAVLDGSSPVTPEAWEHVDGDTFRFRPPRGAFQVLYLGGKPADRVRVTKGGPRPPLKPLQWCLFEGHVYFRTEADHAPASYALSHTALRVGITIYEARNILIRDLVVQGYQLDGVNAHDSVFATTLSGLTCRGNGRSGISIGGASRVQVVSSLVGNNGVAQLRTEGYSQTRLTDCDLVDDDPAAPAIVRDGGKVVVEKPAEPTERQASTSSKRSTTVR